VSTRTNVKVRSLRPSRALRCGRSNGRARCTARTSVIRMTRRAYRAAWGDTRKIGGLGDAALHGGGVRLVQGLAVGPLRLGAVAPPGQVTYQADQVPLAVVVRSRLASARGQFPPRGPRVSAPRVRGVAAIEFVPEEAIRRGGE